MPLPANFFNQCTVLVEPPFFYCKFYGCLSTRVIVLYDVLDCFAGTGLLCDIFLCLHIVHERLTRGKGLERDSVGELGLQPSNGGIQHPPLP